jgi:death on curing protein
VEPRFLSIDEVLAIHADQVARYGGSSGLREEGLLLSALAMPQASFAAQYLHADDFEMAAAYLFHLVMDHAFVDGNKRVGVVSARVFLRLNGWIVTMPEDVAYDLVIAVTAGTADKPAIADAFRRSSKRAE